LITSQVKVTVELYFYFLKSVAYLLKDD